MRPIPRLSLHLTMCHSLHSLIECFDIMATTCKKKKKKKKHHRGGGGGGGGGGGTGELEGVRVWQPLEKKKKKKSKPLCEWKLLISLEDYLPQYRDWIIITFF